MIVQTKEKKPEALSFTEGQCLLDLKPFAAFEHNLIQGLSAKLPSIALVTYGELMDKYGGTAIYSDRGADGAPSQKTTQFMVSPALAARARLSLGRLMHNVSGSDQDDGQYRSKAS